MKHVTRLLSIVVVLLLLAVPLSSVFAQTDQNPLCNGLSAEDCDFVTSSQQMVATATSFAIPAMEVSFNINDGSSNTAFGMKASGEVMLPESGHFLLHLALTDISMEPVDPTVPSELEVLVNDTMAFVNYNGEWYGQELSDKDKADLQDALGQLTGAMAMGGGDMGMGDMGIDLTGVITTTRGDDTEMMGMNMATFSTSIDLTQLLVAVLSSPILGTLLGSSGADMGLGELSPQDLQMMGMIFQPMLAGTTIDLQEWIGLDDMYLHQLVLDVNIHIDLGMFGSEGAAPITGAVHIDVSLDQINEMFDIAAPESYKSIDELNMDTGGLDLGSLGSGLFGQ
jgi:hypothetical protein